MQNLRHIIRKLANNKVYTIINILGLAIAMTTALLIYTFVENENNTDQWHRDVHKIYRFTGKNGDNNDRTAHCPQELPTYAVKEIPGIENTVRIRHGYNYTIFQNETLSETVPGSAYFETDTIFFTIFSFPVYMGETSDFNTNNWMVITESTARKYFGRENPIGKNIRVKASNANSQPSDYFVKAVIRDFKNSSLKTDFIIPFQKETNNTNWDGWGVDAFFIINENTDIPTVEKNMKDMFFRHAPEFAAQYYPNLDIRLQPFQDMYLYSSHISDEGAFPHGFVLWNKILYAIGILILVIAFSNYLIIAMARTNSDITFFTVQKCFGATNRHFQSRLFSEIGLHFTGCLLLSFMLTTFFYPDFTQIISSGHTSGKSILLPQEYLVFLFISGLLFTVTGFILYTYIKKQVNRKSMKHPLATATQRIGIKQTLAIVQMCIFCTLLFCSFILAKQVYHVKNMPLGYNPKNMLYFPTISIISPQVLKEESKNNPDILSITHGTPLPVPPWLTNPTIELVDGTEKKEIGFCAVPGDADYIKTYGIKLIEGENPKNKDCTYTYGPTPDLQVDVLVNQKFIEAAGLTHPIGTLLQVTPTEVFRIAGVTENFHTQSSYYTLKPAIIFHGSYLRFPTHLILSYKEGKRNEVIKYLKEINPAFAGLEWAISDIEADVSNNDRMITNLIYLFTGIALFIGAMGIFAYSLFMATEKKKEVAIRKVNGATEWEILKKLNRGFVLRTLLACGISIPVALYSTEKWLEQFAYQTTLSWWIFPLITGICVCLVVAVTSWQTWKAAIQNPIDSIKRE